MVSLMSGDQQPAGRRPSAEPAPEPADRADPDADPDADAAEPDEDLAPGKRFEPL